MNIEGKYTVGDEVQLSYCDDRTVYEIDMLKVHRGRWIYHLRDAQGWSAEINLMDVVKS